MAVKLRTDRKHSFDEHMLPNRDNRIAAGTGVHVRTNSHPLDTFIDPGSLRTHREWNPNTGAIETVPACVLENAKRHMKSLTIHTVTSARTHPDPETSYGYSGLQAPASIKARANKRKSRKF
jgi:hypothetical protein